MTFPSSKSILPSAGQFWTTVTLQGMEPAKLTSLSSIVLNGFYFKFALSKACFSSHIPSTNIAKFLQFSSYSLFVLFSYNVVKLDTIKIT